MGAGAQALRQSKSCRRVASGKLTPHTVSAATDVSLVALLSLFVLTRVPPQMLCVTTPDTVHSTHTDTAFTFRELCVAASYASPTRSSKCAVFPSRSKSVCRANSGQAQGIGSCLHWMVRVDKLILLIPCVKMNHSDQGCISTLSLSCMSCM